MRYHRSNSIGIESLERRTLLTVVSINVKRASAAEADPSGAGLGQFTVGRAGTDLASPLDVGVRFSPGASTATYGADIEPTPTTTGSAGSSSPRSRGRRSSRSRRITIFLYEGTPGGAIDANNFVVRSDGTQTGIGEEWDDADGPGSANGQEWAYFGDGGVNRFFFLAHNSTDNLEDSYFNLDNNMTVFGFGRHNNPGGEPDKLLGAANNVFTIGLADGGAFAGAAATINGAYQDLNVSQAEVQTRVP
jgi:hypothetical protein